MLPGAGVGDGVGVGLPAPVGDPPQAAMSNDTAAMARPPTLTLPRKGGGQNPPALIPVELGLGGGRYDGRGLVSNERRLLRAIPGARRRPLPSTPSREASGFPPG